MELAPGTKQIARYSPTSTPILDVVRPLPHGKRFRLSAGEYFFLSGAFILTLIALPEFRRNGELLAATLGEWKAGLITCVLIPAGALLFSLAVHQGGHLLAASLTGFRLAPRDSVRSPYSCDVLRLGSLSLEPRTIEHLSRRLGLLVLGGPLASLLVPLLLEVLISVTSIGTTRKDVGFAVHVFTALSVLVGVGDLLPDDGRGDASDGARLVMLLKNDAEAQRWLAVMQLHFALEHAGDPKAWDQTIVASATSVDDDSREAMAGRWFGYLWAAERQDITTATKYLEEALASPAATSHWIRDRLYLEAAMFQAWFRDDLGRARFWAARIRKVGPLQQLRLNVALLWAEGRLFDAWEGLGDYLAVITTQPQSPARSLAEESAGEWRKQMESRMLTRAWRSMYTLTEEVEVSTPQTATSAPGR
jgi:hypothetical protein